MEQRHILLSSLALSGLLVFCPAGRAQKYPSSAQTETPGTKASVNRMTSGDSTFANKAAQGGMAEVKLGELAKEKASNQAVKNFGQKMIDDHTRLNNDLKSVAGSESITLPTMLDSKDQSTYDRLSGLSGPAFDKAYMRDMVSDHRADINEFKHEANDGTDPGLKSFANKALPVLEEHLRLAESAEAQVKGEK